MFRTQFPIFPNPVTISQESSVFLIGSCFSEHISQNLANYKFDVLSNPFGILFNPVSLANQLRRQMKGNWVQPVEIFENVSLFRSFDFHSSCTHPDKEEAIRRMNEAIRSGKIFLEKCTHLIITFGTSLVYSLKSSGRVVANNHKMPSALFEKRQLSSDEIVADWSDLITELKIKYPRLQIIFTLSPVRHLKDGAVENALSKAVLLQSIHQLKNKFPEIYYFPAYEIMMDDLRDYRFYTKDMLHPNEVAIDYIWNIFKKVCINENCYDLIEQLDQIHTAMFHKPFFPELKEHKEFKLNMFDKIEKLQKEFPKLNLSVERNFFT